MSGGSSIGNVEAMYKGIEDLRRGIASMQQEIDRLKAENEVLKGHMLDLQEQVTQAKRPSPGAATAAIDDRDGHMDRILPHDRVSEEIAIAVEIAELERRKKKGGI